MSENGVRRGLTIFFTGLPSAGKTTIAQALQLRLHEETCRPVTLLDGDDIRKLLSSELGFSKEHRDLNIRRIGFVATGDHPSWRHCHLCRDRPVRRNQKGSAGSSAIRGEASFLFMSPHLSPFAKHGM